MAIGLDMDATRITELTSEVRELHKKVDELDWKVRMLKIDALTKVQAIVAVLIVWCLIIFITATRS